MDQQNNRAVENEVREDLTNAGGQTPEAAPERYAEPEIGQERYAVPEIGQERHAAPAAQPDDDDDDAPTEWVPSRFEKKVHAIPEKIWNLWQIAGGIAIGALVVASLGIGTGGSSPVFLVGVVLAILFPKWLEDRGRRSLNKGRVAMIIVMAVGIAGMVIYFGVTEGFHFFADKEETEAALNLFGNLYL